MPACILLVFYSLFDTGTCCYYFFLLLFYRGVLCQTHIWGKQMPPVRQSQCTRLISKIRPHYTLELNQQQKRTPFLHQQYYGYYADQDNECQIFHICVPMKQLFPDLYDDTDILQFSFICPKHTIFTQVNIGFIFVRLFVFVFWYCFP